MFKFFELMLVITVIVLLILLVSLPLHIVVRRMSIISVIRDLRFWTSTILVSLVVGILVILTG